MNIHQGPIGVMLVNLGTPDEATVPAVRRYLREFLMDSRVIDIPYIPRFLLVNGIIAPFRAPKSTKVYKEVWLPEGSPLKIYGLGLANQLQELMGKGFLVKLAMRYQNPSLKSVLEQMMQAGVSKIVVVPLFPQYASATSGSVVDKVMELVQGYQIIPELVFTGPFYNHDRFINRFAEIGKKYLQSEQFDHVLFSYHGIPERHIRKGDLLKHCQLGSCCDSITPANALCYRAQCFETSRRLAKALGIGDNYTTAFQSRLGRDPWIKPYTEDIVKELPKKGYKRVLAFSPAFVADCLETTEEVGMEYKELFEEFGGVHWQLVESLNDNPEWVKDLAKIIEPYVLPAVNMTPIQ